MKTFNVKVCIYMLILCLEVSSIQYEEKYQVRYPSCFNEYVPDGCGKVIIRYYDEILLPDSVQITLKNELKKYLSDKGAILFEFVRCDRIIMNRVPIRETDRVINYCDTFYVVWLKHRIDHNDVYITSLAMDNKYQLASALHFPNVIKNPEKKRVISLKEAIENIDIKFNLGKKIIVFEHSLEYNGKCDILEWFVSYEQKWNLIFNPFPRRRHAFVNAHTGSVRTGLRWDCE